MASTLAGTRLTERHRTRQIALKAVFITELIRLWPLLNPFRLDKTAAAWIDLILDLILGFRDQSIEISLDYYEHFRFLETGGTFDTSSVRDTLTPNTAAMRASLIATGPAKIKHQTRLGVEPRQAEQRALVAVAGAASRHVLNGGRDAHLAAVRDDPKAIGWIRVTKANPCAWCAMIASRGPDYLYGTAEIAKFTTERSPRGPGHLYHDDCACEPQAVYSRRQPWPARNREFAQLWKDATEGYSGKDAINAFRRAYEGQQRRESIPIPAIAS